MHWTPTRQLGLGLLVILLLALLSSGLAWFVASYSAEQLEDQIAENLAQAQIINQLEIALLEQGSMLAFYLLDAADDWLTEYQRGEADFDNAIAQLEQFRLGPDQISTITQIAKLYRGYEEQREEVLDLIGQQQHEAARSTLVKTVSPRFEEVYQGCEHLAATNQVRLDAAFQAYKNQIQAVGRWVVVCLVLLVLLVIGLFWLVLSGVFKPLRRLVSDARQHISFPDQYDQQNEVKTVSAYVDSLRSDLHHLHTRLESSNRHLLDSEQLASIGRIAAGVAHEIRSPLTSLRLRLYAMKKHFAEQHTHDLELITEEVARLERIVRNFLDFSRPPEVQLSYCNLALILDKTLELLRYKIEQRNIKVVRQEPSVLVPVWADHHQLRQVFLNLLTNALDVLPEGGELVLTVQEWQHHDKPVIVVRVKDNGPGMPDEYQSRIFDPFFSTKKEGSGLGLWIAQRIMDQHGGALELESSSTRGTSFAVVIPVAREDQHEHDSDSRR